MVGHLGRAGVFVWEQGKGTIERCDIFGNMLSGVEIKLGGDPAIRDCKIHDSNESVGVHVYEQGKGTVERCHIYNNKLGAWKIEEGCEVRRKDTKE